MESCEGCGRDCEGGFCEACEQAEIEESAAEFLSLRELDNAYGWPYADPGNRINMSDLHIAEIENRRGRYKR